MNTNKRNFQDIRLHVYTSLEYPTNHQNASAHQAEENTQEGGDTNPGWASFP